MTTTPKPLPDQWTISLHTVANLTILTLHDADGVQREIGFHPLTPPGTADRTVTAPEDITEPELRASAHKLIDTFYERTSRAQANADAFGAAVPDQQDLFDRLRSAVPGSRADLDHEALTIVLKLTAAGPAAGALLTLITRWPGSTTNNAPGEQANGVDQELHDDGVLTVVLGQARAEDFLAWYRDQP
ncbi:hypothetical protein [Streptomyces sp. NPDC046985]|uniref:hypothetical protein n=1 Tax=Streptomyces sp. NPDC046985 TaxID=3155377 RepID=UPI0033F35A38